MSNFLDSTGLSYAWNKIKKLLSGKVDKIDGKGLSTEDYTTDEKEKLALFPSATTANNDQILAVVNGVPTWISVINAEEVSY